MPEPAIEPTPAPMTPVQRTVQETAYAGFAAALAWIVYQIASTFGELPGDGATWVLMMGTVFRGIGGFTANYLPTPRGR